MIPKYELGQIVSFKNDEGLYGVGEIIQSSLKKHTELTVSILYDINHRKDERQETTSYGIDETFIRQAFEPVTKEEPVFEEANKFNRKALPIFLGICLLIYFLFGSVANADIKSLTDYTTRTGKISQLDGFEQSRSLTVDFNTYITENYKYGFVGYVNVLGSTASGKFVRSGTMIRIVRTPFCDFTYADATLNTSALLMVIFGIDLKPIMLDARFIKYNKKRVVCGSEPKTENTGGRLKPDNYLRMIEGMVKRIETQIKK